MGSPPPGSMSVSMKSSKSMARIGSTGGTQNGNGNTSTNQRIGRRGGMQNGNATSNTTNNQRVRSAGAMTNGNTSQDTIPSSTSNSRRPTRMPTKNRIKTPTGSARPGLSLTTAPTDGRR